MSTECDMASPSAQYAPVTSSITFKVENGQLGIGANWGTGVVTFITPGGPADKAGVKEGWRLSMIDDATYSEKALDGHFEICKLSDRNRRSLAEERKAPYRPAYLEPERYREIKDLFEEERKTRQEPKRF